VAYDHKQVIEAQYELLTQQRAQQLARYEAARLAEDDQETMDAADRILENDHKLHALGRVANNYVAGQQAAPQQSKYGLSATEREWAHAAFVDRKDMPRMSDDDKEREYSIQKNKLRQMRANGTYSDRG
jgi:hypothetical protein